MKNHSTYDRLGNLLLRTVSPLLVLFLLSSCIKPATAQKGETDGKESTQLSETENAGQASSQTEEVIETTLPVESTTEETPTIPAESSVNAPVPDDSQEIVTPPGEWADIDEGFVELLRDETNRFSIYEMPADIDFKGEDYKLYALMENGEDGRIRWLASGELPISPFYSLHVDYVEGLTFVWGFTKDEAWDGGDGTIEIHAAKAVLKLGDRLIEQEISNDTYLFVIDGYVMPDKLSFYDDSDKLQGGTNDEPSGETFKGFPAPPVN